MKITTLILLILISCKSQELNSDVGVPKLVNIRCVDCDSTTKDVWGHTYVFDYDNVSVEYNRKGTSTTFGVDGRITITKDTTEEPYNPKQILYDSSVGGVISFGDRFMSDSNNKTIDSISNTGIYFKWNYKKVPMGVYSDTAILNDANGKLVQIRVFVDRKSVFYVSFYLKQNEYWDTDIDNKYLQSKLK